MMIPAIGIGPLGKSEWSVGGIGGAGASPAPSNAAAPAGGKNFGDALSNAIGSLETTQANATQASAQLATGQSTDPTQAITAVENASLSMDFASQIRNQVDTVATTLFQTQL
jgi:flagellar hook-basal body complex protein FliE